MNGTPFMVPGCFDGNRFVYSHLWDRSMFPQVFFLYLSKNILTKKPTVVVPGSSAKW